MAPCENISDFDTRKAPFLQPENKSDSESFPFLGGAFGDEGGVNSSDCAFWNGAGKIGANCSVAASADEISVKLNKFQIIKAVVLAGVTVVIMISICRMVFQLFVRYNVRHDR